MKYFMIAVSHAVVALSAVFLRPVLLRNGSGPILTGTPSKVMNTLITMLMVP